MQQWLNCSFLCVRSFRLKDADCLIECLDEKDEVKFRGTGFYYGDGWVMIVADNVQDDDKDDETFRSYLSEGKFRVLFYVKDKKQQKEPYTFCQRKRMAFVHHLNPADDNDFKNKDIWMVRLGVQYERRGDQDDFNDWEKQEKEKLNEIFPGHFGFAQMAAADPKEEDDVYVVDNADDKKTKLVKEMKIRAITKGKQAKTTTSKRSKPGDKRTILLIDYLAHRLSIYRLSRFAHLQLCQEKEDYFFLKCDVINMSRPRDKEKI